MSVFLNQNIINMIKREEDHPNEVAMMCGKNTDSVEVLKRKCEDTARNMLRMLNIPPKSEVIIPFYTYDNPEKLICNGYFKNLCNGKISYHLDYTVMTV